MKNPDRKTVSKLEMLPNIGQAIADDLRLIGIQHPKDLINQDPLVLYKKLAEKTHNYPDPCELDVFISVVEFMQGNEPQPWWKYTQQRKNLLAKKENN